MVDDSEIVIESVQRWLVREGYEVVVTHDCAEARAAAKQHQFCGHIIDLELSDGNGIDLARWLREEGHRSETIFYTGDTSGSEAFELAHQFGRVVVKGENPRVLLSAVRELTHSLRPTTRSRVP
jgi:DNA-binding response OmpR family regulator